MRLLSLLLLDLAALSPCLCQPLLNVSQSYTFTVSHGASLTVAYRLEQPAEPREKQVASYEYRAVLSLSHGPPSVTSGHSSVRVQ